MKTDKQTLLSFIEPFRIYSLLQNYSALWGIAGGWAIDLFLGRQTRAHHDIEIFILRKQQFLLRDYLPNWDFQYSNNGILFDWKSAEFLELPIHELQGIDTTGERLEVLLNESEEGLWKFRRDLSITYPLNVTIIASGAGIPILRPEIVLLFKAKNIRPKDTEDLKNVLPDLEDSGKAWLAESIHKMHGNKHEWLSHLQG